MTKPNDFLSIKDFTPRQIRRFLHLASAIKLQPELTKFLRQDMGDWIARDEALRALKATLGRSERAL